MYPNYLFYIPLYDIHMYFWVLCCRHRVYYPEQIWLGVHFKII